MKFINIKRPMQVNLGLCRNHQITPSAQLLAEIILSGSQINAGRLPVSIDELAGATGMPASAVQSDLKLLKQLGFISYSKEGQSYAVTSTYIEAFVMELEDVNTKVNECAQAFAHARMHYAGLGNGTPTQAATRAVAKILADPRSRYFTPATFGALVAYHAQSFYDLKKKPEMKKYIRASTLLGKKDVWDRFDQTIEWVQRQKKNGLFAK